MSYLARALAALALGWVADAAQAAPILTTQVEYSNGPLVDVDGPQAGGSLSSSLVTNAGASLCGITGTCAPGQTGSANGLAGQNETVFGTFSALVADATFFDGSLSPRTITSRTIWEDSPLASGAAAITLLIKPGELSVVDFASVVFGSPTQARYRIELSVNGTVVFFSEAIVAGGPGGVTLTESGTDLGGTLIPRASFGNHVRGYAFDSFAATIALGNLSPSDVVRYTMEASVSAPGIEAGGFARIGDPFDLSGGGGSVGFAAVPEPSAALLLGALGLAAFARSRRARSAGGRGPEPPGLARRRELGWLSGVCLAAALAFTAMPPSAQAQGIPSNAADTGGSFVGPPGVRSERAWSGALRVFADYDSNIGLTEDNPPAPFEAEGGLRSGLGATGSFRLLRGEALEAGVAAFAAQTISAGDSFADEYDLGTVAPQLWANARFAALDRPAFAQLTYQFRRDWLEGDDFERSHSLRARSGVRLSDRFELGASYAISFDDFDASGFHALDARRDADHHRFGLSASWLRAERGRSFTLGYEYLSNRAENDDYDFRGHGLSARFQTPLAQRALLELTAAYTSVDYFNFTTTPQREARTQRYGARLLFPLARRLFADLGVTHARIGADQARFRARRSLVSGGLTISL